MDYKSIKKREQELLAETWRLKQAGFETTQKKGDKKKHYERARNLYKQEDELYKKQQFFKGFIKEMEKKK